MNILVTGSAGFIGFHVANRLIKEGHSVVGIDSINDYYDTQLKYDRLAAAGIDIKTINYNTPAISKCGNYTFYYLKIENKAALLNIFDMHNIDYVIHLAAQAGVRYSLENTEAYINSNIVGFANMLDCCREYKTKHFVYASSSSVYGLNDSIPFTTQQNVDHPISLYAASKKSNELMAHVYSHLFNVPTTGLRFFTVYGPWGRPDMAPVIFTKAITEGKPIQVFNNGNMKRDFTFIDDIVEGVLRVLHNAPGRNDSWSKNGSDISSSSAPYKIYNIGNNAPVKLMDFISAIETQLGREAVKEFMPLQPGDVTSTYADVSDLVKDTGYKPATSIETGVEKFIKWYKEYHKIE
ncbi:NAD-dependent epimerase [Limnovirga soli]|jgi:UDP-glucuronate 4-epimerase|uniref:NAD-dependent epimerase/dehydratase family protein n=1 Tax=Limnovirga soli TaxID=2656915 RepID=A0A8J8FCH3_9BACT|nr:NAD-dependent epimerase [Limnovirga soli]NNV55526.1 NAD-dependent epimerase/dehydratase family protein [Limnovirga soli]